MGKQAGGGALAAAGGFLTLDDETLKLRLQVLEAQDSIDTVEADYAAAIAKRSRLLAERDAAEEPELRVGKAELEEKLLKGGSEVEVKRPIGNSLKVVRGFAVEAGESSYKKLQRLLEQVKSQKIKGIENIKRAIIKRRGERYVIYTEGSNLERVLELPFVDPAQTTTNSIQEIFDVLGVEAARNAIVDEAFATLSEQGLIVDIRHIMLVADMMTNDGDVKAIGRHGISGRKSSVLARAAFEITAHHLLHAAITGEVDYLDGVAENVIVGQPVTLGTGAVNLVYQPPPNARKPAAAPKPTSAATPWVVRASAVSTMIDASRRWPPSCSTSAAARGCSSLTPIRTVRRCIYSPASSPKPYSRPKSSTSSTTCRCWLTLIGKTAA